MNDSFESGSIKSDIQDVEEFDLEKSRQVATPKLPQLCKSQCFVLILKLYFSLHQDIAPYDLAKLQLLNKRCYEVFIPRAMSDLKINLQMSPCLLSAFEPDVQAMIEDKK